MNELPPEPIDVPRNTDKDERCRPVAALAGAPRIEPLPASELTPDLLSIIEPMVAVNAAINARDQRLLTVLVPTEEGASPGPDATAALAALPEIVLTMLRHPELFALQTDIGVQLLARGALAPRDRELAILRVAWLCQAPYEWGEHVLVAKNVGVTSEECERITQGSAAAGWSEHESAILKAVEELREHAIISDATWQTLAQRLDDRQLIELPIVIGQYQTVAYYQNSLRLRLHEGNRGLDAR